MVDRAGSWREPNRAYWDERVPIHPDGAFSVQRQSLQSPDDEVYRHPEGAPRYPLTCSIRAGKV